MTDDIVTRLRRDSQYMILWPMVEEAADEIERLRAERDEARRMVCSAYAPRGRDIATERGWDCWKEDGK